MKLTKSNGLLVVFILSLLQGCVSYENVTGKRGHFQNLKKGDIIELTVLCEYLNNKGIDYIYPVSNKSFSPNKLIPGTKIKFLRAYELEAYMTPRIFSEEGEIISGPFKGRKVDVSGVGRSDPKCYKIIQNETITNRER